MKCCNAVHSVNDAIWVWFRRFCWCKLSWIMSLVIRLDQLMMTVMVCVCVSGVAAELQAAVLSPMSQVQSTASGLCAADMARLPDTWSLSWTVQALMTCYLLTWSSCDCSAGLDDMSPAQQQQQWLGLEAQSQTSASSTSRPKLYPLVDSTVPHRCWSRSQTRN